MEKDEERRQFAPLELATKKQGYCAGDEATVPELFTDVVMGPSYLKGEQPNEHTSATPLIMVANPYHRHLFSLRCSAFF